MPSDPAAVIILCLMAASAAAHRHHHHFYYDYGTSSNGNGNHGHHNYVAHHASSLPLEASGGGQHIGSYYATNNADDHHLRASLHGTSSAAAALSSAVVAAVAQPLLPSSSLPVTALLFATAHDRSPPYAPPAPLPLSPPPPPLPVISLLSPAVGSDAHKTPLNIMVDISNRLAFAVLDAHTEPHRQRRRPQNFAYSPAGLTSVLIALWEGTAGAGGAHEIYRAMRLPWDRDVVRVGVRDMHRRLREYFYAEENLLDGLSLSRDNVTIRPEYEAILRFYGYDLSAATAGEEMQSMATTTFNVAATTAPVITTAQTTTPSSASTIRAVTATAVTVPLMSTMMAVDATTNEIPMTTTSVPIITVTQVPEERSTPIASTEASSTTGAMTTSTTEMIVTTTTAPPVTDIIQTTTNTTTQSATITTEIQTEPPTTTTTPPTPAPPTTTVLPITTTQQPSPTTTPYTAPITTQLPTTFVPLIAQRIPSTTIMTSTQVPAITSTTAAAPTTVYVFTFKPPASVTTTVGPLLEARGPLTTRISRTFATSTMDPDAMPTDTATESTIVMSTTTVSGTATSTDETTIMTTTSAASDDQSETTTESQTQTTTTSPDTSDSRERRARFRSVAVGPASSSATHAQQRIVTPLINRQARKLAGSANTTTKTLLAGNKRVKKFLHYNRKYFDMLPFARPQQSFPHQFATVPTTDWLSKLHRQCCANFNYATPNPNAYIPYVEPPPQYHQQQTAERFIPSAASAYEFPVPTATGPTFTTTTTATRLPQSQVGMAFTSYAAAIGDTQPYHGSNNVTSAAAVTTQQLPFHIDARLTVAAPFRVLTAPLRLGYATALQASVLELPLDSPHYVLLLMLPDVAFDLNGLMQRMMAPNRVAPTVREIRGGMRPFWIRATVPIVQLKGSAVLTADMMKLGVKEIFEPARADFTPMTDERGIYAKHIEQLITLNIQTASGTNAADNRPADALYNNPIEVNVQQPFVFCIVDTQNDLIIMIGQIVNPLSSRIL